MCSIVLEHVVTTSQRVQIRAYFAKQEFELVPDGLALNVGPCHQEVDDGCLISACVRI